IAGKRGISEGIAVVPDLHLLRLVEIVCAIEGNDVDVSLLESGVGACSPAEPELIAGPGRTNDAVPRKRIAAGAVEVLRQPILVVRRRGSRRVVGPTRDADIAPEIG